MKNYYKILGIPRTANDAQIKKAYRKLALKWHPDKNKSTSARDKFLDITEAYKILSDPKSRGKYDRGGRTRTPKPSSPQPQTKPKTEQQQWADLMADRVQREARREAQMDYRSFKKRHTSYDVYDTLWVVNFSLLAMALIGILLSSMMITGMRNEYETAGAYDRQEILVQIDFLKGVRSNLMILWLILLILFYCLVKFYPKQKKN